ncbi:MAG: hypothetical protein LPK85_09610, partial [Gammaproteobacteria bacterium]|nr:hypothetical protein [Gammaproteobacteria bacterium]
MTRQVISRWTWRSVWGWLLCSALCVGWAAPSRAETAFLPVDEAFRLSVSTPGESAVLSWHIAPGYYLYARRVSVQVADGETLEGEFLTPAQTKQDPYFGEQAVFHDQAQWQAPPGLPAGVDLTVRYQ